jgi:tRNA threonylcarbamoyladenosine modification (KEOPS) complex Cgi121 subunit
MVKTSTIKGSDRAVSIGGFRGAPVNDVDYLLGILGEAVTPAVFQIFDATRIAGWRHLYMAAVNAVGAFEAGSVGVSSGTEELALVVVGGNSSEAEEAFGRAASYLGKADDSVLELNAIKLIEVAEVFGISDNELDAVGREPGNGLSSLLVEKGALLPLRR